MAENDKYFGLKLSDADRKTVDWAYEAAKDANSSVISFVPDRILERIPVKPKDLPVSVKPGQGSKTA